MTSLGRNLTTLLLFLNLSPFLLHLVTQAASIQPSLVPVTRKKINYMTILDIENEYENYGEDHSSPPDKVFPAKTTLLRRSRQFCVYDSCLENQEPCAQIASRTGCLCPGVSGPDLPPHAPRLKEFLTVAKGEHTGSIEVHWCAPLSVVSKYRVVVEKSDRPAVEFSHSSRRGLVGSLEPGDKVCVLALNNAGSSSPLEHSCSRFERNSNTSDGKLLIGLIGGGIALLVLIIVVAVVVAKYKTCKKVKSGSRDGLGNPSFSRAGSLWSRAVVKRQSTSTVTKRTLELLLQCLYCLTNDVFSGIIPPCSSQFVLSCLLSQFEESYWKMQNYWLGMIQKKNRDAGSMLIL